MSPLQSLVACGTKLWLDSIDPDLVKRDRAEGATGATSNPIIISDLIRTGRFDANIQRLVKQGLSDSEVALLLGAVMKYEVTELVDPEFNVVSKVPKSALAMLAPVKK